jgi:hypothetical protein
VVTREERAASALRGACVASFRINMTARVWPFIVPAAVLISVGALGVCMAFVTHGPLQPYASEITLGGAVCMLAGLLLTIFAARPVLTHDEYVAALETGLLCKLDGEETFLLWNAIAAVRWDAAASAVRIEMREGEPLVVAKPFGTATGDAVAAKLDDVRRKADFHLL